MSRGALIVVMMLIAAIAAGCSGKVQPGETQAKRPVVAGVTVAEVKLTPVDDYYETVGTINARTVSQVASKIMGTVTAVLVKEGDKVRAGQTLLTLDDREYAPRVAGAEAGRQEAAKALEIASQNQNLANVTYERYQQLYNHKAVTGQEMDQIATQKRLADLEKERAEAAVGRAQASLTEASVYQGFSQVTAPVDGIITAKKTDVGSMAVPGVPLMVVEDQGAYVAEADIDESFMGKLTVGTTMEILLPDTGYRTSAKITQIVPAVDPAARKFHIKAILTGTGLHSGQYIRLLVPTGKKEALLLPQKAIVDKGQLEGVYSVNQDGVVVYRVVKLGKKYGSQVEVVSGLNPQEKVIVDGLDKVVDGGVVKEVTS